MDHIVAQQPAYVIHARSYRETSYLVELFTRDFGRVGAVARGMRKLDGKLGASLQPFRPLLVSWRGRGELKTMNSAEPGGPGWLTGQRLWAGLYVNELVTRLLHRFDPHAQLFGAYTTVIASLLLLGDDDVEPALRRFEKVLLSEVGYGVAFTSVDGHELERDRDYRYDPERGFVPLGRGVGEGERAPDVFRGEELFAIAEDRYDARAVRASAKRLMRLALRPRLGTRPLNSRRLYA